MVALCANDDCFPNVLADEFFSREKFPNASGRLVLQDLPVVIDAIQKLDPKIECMKHDFHTEQPVKGTLNHSNDPVLEN